MGTELVENGSFATNTIWTKGTGWTISGGEASKTAGTESDLEQTISELVVNQTYRTVFVVFPYTAGTITLLLDGTSGTVRSSSATFTELIKAGGSGSRVELRGNSAFIGTVDNVSVQLAFDLVPSEFIPIEPDFYNIISTPESFKKQYQNIEETPVERYQVRFRGLSDANFLILHNHYKLCLGGYEEFIFNQVPSYIDTDGDGVADGTALEGRWVKGSYRIKQYAYSWDCELVFEVDV